MTDSSTSLSDIGSRVTTRPRTAEVVERPVNFCHIDGADGAEVLGHHEIGIERPECIGIERVEVFAGRASAHLRVDLRWTESAGRVVFETIVRVRASLGKSHSKVTPTTSGPAPSAKRISVADGKRDTIRTEQR